MNVKRILIVQPALRAAAYAFVGTALPALGFPVEIAVLAHFFRAMPQCGWVQFECQIRRFVDQYVEG